MSDAYLGEIRIFGGNYAPYGWAFCDGQLLTITEHPALYSLLGTAYGGDGRTTFALPDLRGRLPIHYGTGPGLTTRPIGARFGQETVALSVKEMPSHSHPMMAINTEPTQENPQAALWASSADKDWYATDTDVQSASNLMAMPDGVVGDAGSSVGHYNMMPFLVLNFIIYIKQGGAYPPRN